ncbi:hypothetical protein [Sulfitobacter sp. SK012]|nr:hypothetical protein [Sulfitobacter sp. SK012]
MRSLDQLAVTFTNQERYFVSESTAYRVLKAHAAEEMATVEGWKPGL